MGGEGCFLTLNRPAHGLLGKRVHEESMAINCARPLLLFFFLPLHVYAFGQLLPRLAGSQLPFTVFHFLLG